MNFAARITRCPIAFDPARGDEAAARLGALPPELHALVAGAAGSSPYLDGLVLRESGWIAAALAGSPEDALDAELAALAGLDPATAEGRLRAAKRRIALLVALADLGGVWPLETVTAALTRLADAAVQAGLALALAPELARGRIPGQGPDAAADAAGMAVFAMGKMGAFELNYSSDIDLICLYDEGRFAPGEAQEARAAFIRATRRMTALLSDITANGYVFRVDLRLRPDAAVTPVCLGMEAAERYYESLGRTWERAAWIKARPCAGDLAGGARFARALSPFVWRRHLDFAAIRDAHDMRLRIREHKGLWGQGLDGRDLKLAAGGIREIEFFTQTRQLIAGGRDPSLRGRGTVEALAALAAAGWLPGDVAAELTAAYRGHREIEHRLQMVADQQTHSLPATPEAWERLACLTGSRDPGPLRDAIAARVARVAELATGFFDPEAQSSAQGRRLSAEQAATVERWRGYPALRTERARESLGRLAPALFDLLDRAARPDEALANLDAFLRGLPAGVQLLALFEANPSLVELIVDVVATAPALARYLARNSGVLDAVLGGDFFAPWPDGAALARSIADRMAAAGDYEKRLDAARAAVKEWHFRIGVHHLRNLIDADEAGRQYADLAAATVAAVFPIVADEVARRHGPPPGRGAVVIGMGSLGAGRLHAASDLDLIVIYDPADAEMSEGPRPLAARAHAAKLTQALVTALSAPMAEGRLYEVDMRLRPSGRQGPVATSFAAFRAYQETEAWTWEHLALTRARVVASAGADAAALAAEVEAFRRALLPAAGARARVLPDAAAMRARLHAAKPAEGPWDVKRGPGGLSDIELLAATAALRTGSAQRGVAGQLALMPRAGLGGAAEAAGLAAAWRQLWAVQAAGRLLSDRALDPRAIGAGARAVLLRGSGADSPDELAAALSQTRATAAAAIDRAFATAAEGTGGRGGADDAA